MGTPPDKLIPDGATYTVGPISQFDAFVSDSVPEGAANTVRQKQHAAFFQECFSRIRAKTLVLERPYIDRDFLEDFSAYYVRCFENYERKCARLHFFSNEFKKEEFDALLRHGETPLTVKKLQEGYLGFMVIKPLPKTFFGRTCLTTQGYPAGALFPAGHKFPASLFGIELCVENTLPFQEQDSVVAACATSALWTSFHGTGRTFQHAIPSPVEITKAATKQLPAESRALPNHGLHPHMMAQAIREVGLEPHYVAATDFHVLLPSAYAYLRAGIPPVLGVNLLDKRHIVDDPKGVMGRHAVTITGLNFGLAAPRPIGPAGFLLKAMRIDKLYVHDDGVGPYARMEMYGQNATVQLNDKSKVQVPAMGTSWLARTDRSAGNVVAQPEILMMPLYHKIRIPYELAQKAIVEFDGICVSLGKKSPDVGLTERFEWDIYLTTVNQVKSEVYRNKRVLGEALYKTLTSSTPRFLWRATALQGGSAKFDLLLDATDIEHGTFVVRVISYNDVLQAFLAGISVDDGVLEKAFPSFPHGRRVLRAFKPST